MNIRCERCSTTYELDETLLAPEGSAVQCTKCQHVFTAVPPRTAGRTLVGVPAAPAPQPSTRAAAARPPSPPPAAPPSSSPARPVGARPGPAIYRPAAPAGSGASGVAPGARPAQARRDTMGTFEARLKVNARLRWLVPLVAVVVGGLAIGVGVALSRRIDPAATRRHAEAMALVALDDLESLEKAARLMDDLASQKVRIPSLDADRALCRVLLATGVMEDVAPAAQKLAAKVAERDRASAAQPPTPPDVVAQLTAQLEALRAQVEPRQGEARTLRERAYADLKRLGAERGGDLAVARALAIHFAASGEREQALRFIRGSGNAERDPWIQLAEGWLDAREDGKEPRERAVTKLSSLIASHPEIVRARFLLARTQASLGRRESAAAALDGLLAANPRHHRASRMRAELVGAGAPALVPAPAAPAPGPAAVPGARPIGAPGLQPPAPAAPRPAVLTPAPGGAGVPGGAPMAPRPVAPVPVPVVPSVAAPRPALTPPGGAPSPVHAVPAPAPRATQAPESAPGGAAPPPAPPAPKSSPEGATPTTGPN